MGWIFGCFSCGKSSCKDVSPPPSYINKSSHLRKQAVTNSNCARSQDLFTVRQVSSGNDTASKKPEQTGPIILKGVPRLVSVGGTENHDIKLPCDKNDDLKISDSPFRLDDLEEELENIKLQIEKESKDTKEIKEKGYADQDSKSHMLQTARKYHSISEETSKDETTQGPSSTSQNSGSTTGYDTSDDDLVSLKIGDQHSPLLNTRSPMKNSGFDIMPSPESELFDISDDFFRRPLTCSAESELQATIRVEDEEDLKDYSLSKKRRLGEAESSEESQYSQEHRVTEDDIDEKEHASSQKRQKPLISAVESSPIEMHFFGCDTLSTISESENEDLDSSVTQSVSRVTTNDCYDAYDSAQSLSQIETVSVSRGQSSPKSVSVTTQSFSQTETVSVSRGYSSSMSVSVTATNSSSNYSDGISYTTSEKYSGESSCIHGENDDKRFDSASETHSVYDSEETISNPENCCSPPISSSHGNGISEEMYRGEDTSVSTFGGTSADKSSSFSSRFTSSMSVGSKVKPSSRYKNIQTDAFEENDYDIDADGTCSEEELSENDDGERRDSLDEISTEFAQRCNLNMNEIETPLKVPSWLSTPRIVNESECRGRTRQIPSVLTPVENKLQWRKLKDQKDDMNTQRFNDQRLNNDSLNDENMNDAYLGVNASFSNWSVKSPGCVDASFSKWGASVKTESASVPIDASLSHWLRASNKHNKVYGGVDSTTSSSDDAVDSPAKVENFSPLPSKLSIQSQQQTPTYLSGSGERPIIGYSSFEYTASAKKTVPSQGIPNTTTKYKEDQQVNWHASPFEVRLEKALDQQSSAEIQKKLFAVPSNRF